MGDDSGLEHSDFGLSADDCLNTNKANPRFCGADKASSPFLCSLTVTQTCYFIPQHLTLVSLSSLLFLVVLETKFLKDPIKICQTFRPFKEKYL